MPIGKTKIPNLAYLAACPECVVADILVAVTGGHRSSPNQRRINRNDIDNTKKGIAAIGNSISAAHDLNPLNILQRDRQRDPIDTAPE
ncbi:MAG: hypothetical protein FD131_1522 [Rhodocyclaceae bacterium]|nr:MAG: hypothetical protein FD131_1522 [Rhodocyclaceae bacterium]